MVRNGVCGVYVCSGLVWCLVWEFFDFEAVITPITCQQHGFVMDKIRRIMGLGSSLTIDGIAVGNN